VLLEIETDKAQMDVEAQEDGKVAKILVGFSCAPEVLLCDAGLLIGAL